MEEELISHSKLDFDENPHVGNAPIDDSACMVPKTSQEWEAKRSIITKLYLEDGLKLKDVQTVLETQHGFKAT